MKQAKLAVVAMLVMVFSIMAVAQQLIASPTIVVQVPFEFVAANKIVPAGECEVQAITMDGRTLMIRNGDAKVSLFASTSRTESKQSARNYTLVFNRYGGRYFLTGVKLEGSKITYLLPESRAEVELRAQKTPSTEETLVATLK
jgi:hypothetical protein